MLQSKIIEQAVNSFRTDYVFTYRDLGLPPESSANVIRKLNRMADMGVIQRLSKGRFYKPKQTMFGNLKPSQQEVVKDLLEKDDKIVGYLTGVSIFGQLGLTTQISNVIEIGVNGKRIIPAGGYIQFVLFNRPIRYQKTTFLYFNYLIP